MIKIGYNGGSGKNGVTKKIIVIKHFQTINFNDL